MQLLVFVAAVPAVNSFAADYILHTVLHTSHCTLPAVVHNPDCTARSSAGRTVGNLRSSAAGYSVARTGTDRTRRIAEIAVRVGMIEHRAEKRRHRVGRYSLVR